MFEHYQSIKNFYTAPLQAEIEEAVETLQDLYIEPNFLVSKKNLKSKPPYLRDFFSLTHDLSIHEFINEYFIKERLHPEVNKKYNMLFVLGQPGQGKTSFCYRTIYDLLNVDGLPDYPLYFIKIRDLHAKDFITDTFNTINSFLNQNIDFTSDKALLILDGLDEAFMSGGLTDFDLKNLYDRLNKTSQQNKKLKIILTSRLNYLDIHDPSLDGSLVVMLNVLNDKQILEYIEKFKRFHPNNLLASKIDKILDKEEFYHIKELLEQPVLMYFIALSNINIEQGDSKSFIYEKIFESLAKRSWDKNGQLNYIRPELKENYDKYNKYLRNFIRSIAFEIYQSPNLNISIKKLLELNATKEFVENCLITPSDNNSQGIKEISKYLLISFYFQASNKNNEEDAAIEFFHNSLWEFLTAEYIWSENKKNVLKMDYEGDLVTLDMEDYFNMLRKLVGNKHIKREVASNLLSIISLEKDETKEKIFNQSKSIFYRLVKKNMLLSYDYRNEILTSKEKTQNIFELFWHFIHSCLSDNNKLITNEKMNEYLFSLDSSLSWNNSFKHIEVEAHFFPELYLTKCSFSKSRLGGEYIHMTANECLFEDVEFSKVVLRNHFVDNEFNRVVIKGCYLSKYLQFENNKFEDCMFLDVEIESRSIYKSLLDSNYFDDNFMKNHKVVSRLKEIGEGKKRVYYITYKPASN